MWVIFLLVLFVNRIFTLNIGTPYCLNHICPKIWTNPLYFQLTYLETSGWVANSVDPDQMPHMPHLIRVYTDCWGLSVPILWPASVVHLDAHPTGDQEVSSSIPVGCGSIHGDWSWNISLVILFLLLIQEGQLSVSGERFCTSTGTKHA